MTEASVAQAKYKSVDSVRCPNTGHPCFCTTECQHIQGKTVPLVAIDPGPHLGFAFFKGKNLHLSGMVNYSYESLEYLLGIISSFEPEELVIEDFYLFPSKALAQSWSKMQTPRIIGSLEYWAWKQGLPVIYQPPANKQAFPDERLKELGVYVQNDHARDAIRHGLYRLHYGREIQ